jgi:hypothetical protein
VGLELLVLRAGLTHHFHHRLHFLLAGHGGAAGLLVVVLRTGQRVERAKGEQCDARGDADFE